MKKLTILICLISAFAYGQTPNPINSNFTNGFEASKFLNIPHVAVPSTVGLKPGAFNWFDGANKLGTWSGTVWNNIATEPWAVATFKSINYVPTWSEITSKPTTVSGYGITDTYTKTESDNLISLKIDLTQKGNAFGVATLNGSSQVPDGQIASNIARQSAVDLKQNLLTGTGFVKSSGGTISYDNTTYYPASNPNAYISSYTESDPLVASYIKAITSTNISNWNTAYSWGNHATQGYLTSESDPTVSAYVKSITASYFANGNTAYSWGNHAGLYYPIGNPNGYISSYTETDPLVASFIKAISSTDISHWNTAYSWGNHASAGYALNSAVVHTTGDESIYGYKRFFGDMGIGSNIFMGGSPADSFSGSGVQVNNTTDASTTTGGFKIVLGVVSDMIFYVFNGSPGAISAFESFRIINTTGVLRYAASHTYTNDHDIVDKAYVDSRTGGYIKGSYFSESGDAVSSINVTFTTPMSNTSYNVQPIPTSSAAGSSHWYITGKTTTYFTITFGTPIVENLLTFDYVVFP